ncbi:MAG: hypothetical protein AAFV07_04795 [Bacteroidota bacterium]
MEQFDEIEAWLEGELTPQAAEKMAARVQAEPELAAAVRRHRQARKLLEAGVGDKLRQDLASMAAEEGQVIRPRWWAKPQWILVAASLLILMAVAGWQRGRFAGDRINAQAFEAYPALSLRQIDTKGPNEALRAYAEGAYETVIETLPSLPANSMDDVQKQFLLGVSHLALDQASQAESALEKVLAANDPRFNQAASWYMVLAKAGGDNWQEARQVARQITEDGSHPYQQDAADWLAASESFWFHP